MSKKPNRSQAMLSMCSQCMGYYADGKVDCGCVSCPHYMWMPYRKQEPDLSWMNYNPKAKGKVTWEESKRNTREMSEEEKRAFVDRVQKAKRNPVQKAKRNPV